MLELVSVDMRNGLKAFGGGTGTFCIHSRAVREGFDSHGIYFFLWHSRVSERVVVGVISTDLLKCYF